MFCKLAGFYEKYLPVRFLTSADESQMSRLQTWQKTHIQLRRVIDLIIPPSQSLYLEDILDYKSKRAVWETQNSKWHTPAFYLKLRKCRKKGKQQACNTAIFLNENYIFECFAEHSAHFHSFSRLEHVMQKSFRWACVALFSPHCGHCLRAGPLYILFKGPCYVFLQF